MVSPPDPPESGRWDRIEEICFGAMQRTGAEREAFLRDQCADDPELRAEIESLLTASEANPDFLARPAVSLAGLAAPEGDEMDTPAHIGPYRIVRPLGEGGMGRVWLAVRDSDGFSQTVAVKVIRRGIDTDRVLDRFRQERRILAGLRHPNIAALIDGGATADGRPYFVMEYVEGEPIDRYCDRLDLDLAGRLTLVRALCSALHHAHQNLVVHRDIKPANVLVTPAGVPKLLDFGIGKMLAEDGSEETPATRHEDRVLTPEYAAPEQIEGGVVTTATDVFGLGVLLYRLLTGRLPWEPGDGKRDARRAPRRNSDGAIRETPRPPSAFASKAPIPADVDAVVLKALRSEPAERYPGPLALADDLQRFLGGRPVLARRPSALYTLRKFVRRHRVPVAAGAVVFAALLSASAYTWRQSLRVAAERDRALEVRGLLLETFGTASPDRAGDPVTARALLDGQAALVRDLYADDPALLTEMTIVLAEGYERLGLLAEAEAWAERAVRSAESVGPVETASARTLLGWTWHQQGRSQEALDLLEAAVEEAGGAAHGERALSRALNDLGVVREALGDYDGAFEAHDRAMTLRMELYGPRHRSVAVSASNLSAVHYRMGDLGAAVEMGERALELIRASFGPDHQRAIIVQSNLAVFKLVDGDLQGAEEDYRDLLARQSRLQGRDHPVTVRVMASLATVLRRAEKFTEAEGLLREALRIERDRPDPNPVDIGHAMSSLGDVMSSLGNHAEAIAQLEDALELQIDALGTTHVEVAQTQSYLSRAWERSEDPEMARQWQERVVSTLTDALGEDHPQTLSERERLLELTEADPPG